MTVETLRLTMDRARRWGHSTPRRLAIAGGLVTASWAFSASAQEHVAPTLAASAPVGAVAAPHEGAEQPEHGEHALQPPNFTDMDRWREEKARAARGEAVTPVTPYIYVLINAVLLFAIYYHFGKKPVADGLKARRDTVAKELDEAAKIKAEAQAKLAEYSGRIAKLDEELKRIKAELIAAGESERDRLVKDAEAKAARTRREAEFLLDQEMKQLRNDLLRSTVEAATSAAAAVLKAHVSAVDHERVAEDYLRQVATVPGLGMGATKATSKESVS